MPETKTEVLPPNRAKPFRVRIGCWTGHAVPSSKSAADSLIGLADRRRRLAVNQPVLVEVQHLLAVCVRINSEDGKRQDLYCDHLYQLTSRLRPAAQGQTNSELERGTEERLEDATSSVLVLLKSHEETLAYERAKLCGSVADGFEASAVSLFCYYGDPASPFRATASTSLFSERDRRPRSNVIEVLTCLQRENPALWRLLHGQLLQLAAGKDKLAAKAQALEQELQAARPARSLVRSLVRVETRPADDAQPETSAPTSPPKPPAPPDQGKTIPADPFGPWKSETMWPPAGDLPSQARGVARPTGWPCRPATGLRADRERRFPGHRAAGRGRTACEQAVPHGVMCTAVPVSARQAESPAPLVSQPLRSTCQRLGFRWFRYPMLGLDFFPECLVGNAGSLPKPLPGRFQNGLQLGGVAHEQTFHILLPVGPEQDRDGFAVARDNNGFLFADLQSEASATHSSFRGAGRSVRRGGCYVNGGDKPSSVDGREDRCRRREGRSGPSAVRHRGGAHRDRAKKQRAVRLDADNRYTNADRLWLTPWSH